MKILGALRKFCDKTVEKLESVKNFHFKVLFTVFMKNFNLLDFRLKNQKKF